MSHRPFRSTLVSVASGLAAAIAISWVCGPAPARAAAGYSAAGRGVQAQEWWLGGLHVRQTWPSTQGAGITVAVLGTGVDPRHPDLTGSVTTGPDFSGSGRTPAGPFWGINGTEVAGAIAGHGHGTGRTDGLLGVAPMAKILSIRVSLEFNDPLNSARAIARRLPGAIASGIIYAVDHGARIIDLPLDPGTAGLTGQGNPAAAGGSPAEQTAVAYALHKNVVLVAPAGDDGQGPDLTDHPAAYTGVIAVGAIARNGQLAPFSSRHSYVSLTAPGVGLAAAAPPDDYARISSTSTSSGIVAGVAALIRSRFPHLSAAQVGQALTGGSTAGRDQRTGHRARHHRRRQGGRPGRLHQRRGGTAPARSHRPAEPDRTAPVDYGGTPGQRQRPGRLAGPVRGGRPVRADRAARGAAPGHALPAGAVIRVQGRHGRSGARPDPPPRPARAASAAARVRAGHRACRRVFHRVFHWASGFQPVSAGSAARPGRYRRLGRSRGLAGRQQPGRDAAAPRRAVRPGHSPGAEAGQGGGPVARGPALGGRTGA